MSHVLVFTACYNEVENIGRLVDQIVLRLPEADILVVDDNSPDGTWEVIKKKVASYPQLTAVQRPRKLGIGSAHKYALLYAMREGYDTLVTMDADFSHDPKYLNELLRAHGKWTFVTGSRYCDGGSSDYKGYRNVISRLGNFAARLALGINLKELTTYYRVFDVESLWQLPLRKLNASGYSFGVRLVYYLHRAGVKLVEVPIHFTDRTHGSSKIPRLQIVLSAIDLGRLMARRLFIKGTVAPDIPIANPCSNCGDRALSARGHQRKRCILVECSDARDRYICLRCGLEQNPDPVMPLPLRSAGILKNPLS